MEEKSKKDPLNKLYSSNIGYQDDCNSESDEQFFDDVLSDLNSDQQFGVELETTIKDFLNNCFDANQLNTAIINLVRKYLQISRARLAKHKSKFKFDENNIARCSKEIIHIITNRHKLNTKSQSVASSAARADSTQSQTDFKKLVKYLVIYEIYKFMSPKRIAGETRKENFAHNMIIGGINRAKHYEGGSKKDVANYSQYFLNKLQVKSRSFKKSHTIS